MLEHEADQFARDWLIAPEQYERFVESNDFTKYSITRFAKEMNIHQGIVVGRLQNEHLLRHDQYNDLKAKYTIKK